MSKVVIVIEEEDGEFFVTSPDLPELLTSGRTLPEALVNAADAATVVLAGREKDCGEVWRSMSDFLQEPKT